MKYLNTKTRAVIETACVISGGNWVEVKKQPKNTKPKAATKQITHEKSGD